MLTVFSQRSANALGGNLWSKPNIICRWQDLQALFESLNAQPKRQWLFRGQRDCGWKLVSSLERAVCERFGQPPERMPGWEKWLLGEFKRHAHRYVEHLPDSDDTLRWLALMQHHGAPTRLLDFTYSLYVGIYFAVESANPGDRCALWAIDGDWCWRRARKQLKPALMKRIENDITRGKTPALQAKVLASRIPRVIPDNSFFLDERLAVQQGVFLVPLDLTKSFMQNLATDCREAEGHVLRYEICLTLDFLKEALLQLRRMNITRGSLFPGLDGFAGSLQARIAVSDPPPRALGVAERNPAADG